jgi:cytochrome P450
VARWAALPNGTIVDFSNTMGALTLQIISRAIFSSDDADMAAVFERSSAEYQKRMTFSFCGLVPLLNRVWAGAKVRQAAGS